MKKDALFVLVIVSQLHFSCSDSRKVDKDFELPDNEKMITKDDYGKDWPFTVDKGILKCVSFSVIFIANGKTYAVNGTALNFADERGYLPLDEIWAPDTTMMKKLVEAGLSKREANESGVRINVGKIIEDGLKLCDE